MTEQMKTYCLISSNGLYKSFCCLERVLKRKMYCIDDKSPIGLTFITVIGICSCIYSSIAYVALDLTCLSQILETCLGILQWIKIITELSETA